MGVPHLKRGVKRFVFRDKKIYRLGMLNGESWDIVGSAVDSFYRLFRKVVLLLGGLVQNKQSSGGLWSMSWVGADTCLKR